MSKKNDKEQETAVQKPEADDERLNLAMTKSEKEKRDDIRRRALFIEAAKLDASKERLITGTVTSVGTVSAGGEKIACVILPYRSDARNEQVLPGVNVIIPINMLFEEDPKILSNDESGSDVNAAVSYLKDMIGAEISYVVTDVIERGPSDTIRVIGNRKRALEILRELDYTDKGKDRQQYVNGGVYWGRVVLTSRTKTIVTLGGIERAIPLVFLTTRYCPNVKKVFYPGKKIPIYVSNITIEDGKINAWLDTLKGESALAAENLKNITIGEITMGTISKFTSTVDGDGKTLIHVYGWHDMYDVPIFFPETGLSRHGVPLMIGDKVMFKVTGISGKYNTVEGRIVQVL